MKKIFPLSAFTLIFFFSVIIVSSGQPGSKEDIIHQLYEKDGEHYFSFQAGDRNTIQELSRIISLDKVEEQGRVFAYANRKEFARFLDYGLNYEILPHPGDFEGFLNIKSELDIRDIREWDFYPTYDAYITMMNQFEEQYPELCQVFSVGTSVQGRELLVAKISDNVGIRENEPQFLYTSSIHGDELTGYILMLRLIDYLLSNYGSDPKVTNLVDNIEIWINPLANPDGTYAGGNTTVSGARRYNANWVDLNRNYADPEDGPNPDGEEWQTETLRFMELAENEHFVASANIHGGAEVCNYPWDTWSRLAADDTWWQYVCHEYADTAQQYSPSGYMSDFNDGITNGYAWYTISGGRQDYMNYFHQAREFTLEISNVKLPSAQLLPAFWDYNYRSLLNYLEQCTFGLRGTVKDSLTGWPLKAEVYALLHEKDSSWVYTDLPNGNYHRLLPEGTYTVRYSAAGYETRFVNNVSITNRQATVLDIKLTPEGVGGIENNYVSRMITVYPNPVAGDVLYFKSDVMVDRVAVSDITGKEIIRHDVSLLTREINLQNLNPGLYFIRFETEIGPGMKKIVIN
jgi:hypothetical protein